MIKDMTNEETREHLLAYVLESHDLFSWPTDVCGYDQHIKFVEHRNQHWKGETEEEWKAFITEYAESLVKTDEVVS